MGRFALCRSSCSPQARTGSLAWAGAGARQFSWISHPHLDGKLCRAFSSTQCFLHEASAQIRVENTFLYVFRSLPWRAPFRASAVQFLHWFEQGQEELQKLMCHQRHCQVSTKLSYRTSPLLEPPSKYTPNITQLSHTHKKSPKLQISLKPGAHQQRFVLIDCRSAKYARTCPALVAWRFSGWLLGCGMTSATTFYGAAVCKALVTEVAQQCAVSIFVRQVLFTPCLLMDLEA